MIDVFNSLVESRSFDIFNSREPYNDLLARIAIQAEVDIIILGGMGLKHDDYLFFRSTSKIPAPSQDPFSLYTRGRPDGRMSSGAGYKPCCRGRIRSARQKVLVL